MTGHQWSRPSHLAVTRLTCLSPASGIFTRVLKPFHLSRYLFHMCHLTASYFHLRLMSTSQTRHPGQRVSSWALPLGVVISRLCCLQVRLPCQAVSCVGAIGGRVPARQCVCKPQSGPLLWGDYRHCCSVQSKKSHSFNSFSWFWATQEGRSLSHIDTSHDTFVSRCSVKTWSEVSSIQIETCLHDKNKEALF